MTDATVPAPAPNPAEPPNRNNGPKPAVAAEPPKQPTVNNNVLFGVAVAILLVILALGFLQESLQYNLLFLMALSLGVAAFMAFLPMAVTVELQWIKAGGSAAIFVFLASQFVPYAKEDAVRRMQLAALGLDPFHRCLENANKHLVEAAGAMNGILAAIGNIGAQGQTPAMNTENTDKIRRWAPEAARSLSAGQTALAACPPKPAVEHKK